MNDILARLHDLRAADAPTHGGNLFSYVYDSGLSELDELAAEAMRLTLPVNGLDPTMFPSVPAMERDLIRFARAFLHGDRGAGSRRVVGSITSGGTESCMLAVKTAREWWRIGRNTPGAAHPVVPRIVAPQTVHPAFHKAAEYFGLNLDLVPVSPDGVVSPETITRRLADDVALVVVSAPSYPTGQLDPVQDVAAAAKTLGISCHVDSCIGGFALPFMQASLPPWDFRVPGVTSISLDLHKYGYAPKGTSILLQRNRARQRKQFFATKHWPGYPVVNPTLLGSRSATSLAAAWAITTRLGRRGYESLTREAEHATNAIRAAVDTIPGLRVMGNPAGPLLAVTADENVRPDERVDPHHLADELASAGFLVQHQPGLTQADGVRIPHSTHLTVTPVTAKRLGEFVPALRTAADRVRGRQRANPVLERTAMRMLGLMRSNATLTPAQAWMLLRVMGVGGGSGSAGHPSATPTSAALPKRMAPLMRLIEDLPASVVEPLLIELLARLSEPR